MYFCGMFNLDDWRESVVYIVLDDFRREFFPQWKCFIGCQKEFVLTDKYRKKKTVRFGRPCIWLCNPEDDPRNGADHSTIEWIEKNAKIVRLQIQLY
jgi:hypothetical protein